MNMKAINYISILAAAVVSLACSKEQVPETGYSVNEFAQSGQATARGRYSVFYADLDSSGDSQSKVYIDGNFKTRWNAGDLISIFQTTANECFAFQGADGDRSGSFAVPESNNYGTGADAGEEIDAIYAVYPYNQGTGIDNGSLRISFPATQGYKPDSYGPGANIMACRTSDERLKFKNVGGYLVIKLYGDGVSVKSVAITSNGGEVLSGQAVVTFDGNSVPEATLSQGTGTVSVVCDNPVTIGTSSTDYTAFWFVLPPVTFSEGFTVTVTGSNGKTCEKVTTKQRTVARNDIVNMAPFEVVLPANQIGDGQEQDGGDY